METGSVGRIFIPMVTSTSSTQQTFEILTFTVSSAVRRHLHTNYVLCILFNSTFGNLFKIKHLQKQRAQIVRQSNTFLFVTYVRMNKN